MKEVLPPTEEALVKSISNQIFFFYVMAFAWVGFMLYGTVYKHAELVLDAIMFFVAACTFYSNQKVDKARLELLRAS